MPQAIDQDLPDRDGGARRLPGFPRRLTLVGLPSVLLLLVVLLYMAYRLPGERRIRQIESLAGTVSTGPTTDFLYDYSKRHFPQSIVRSGWFERLFLPGVYGVDLRNVSDPARLTSGLQAAASFPSITSITLYRSGATDRHVALIAARFPELTNLKLNETSISDAAIAELPRMKCLRALNIQRTAVTDEAIDDLLAIPRLKELIIAETQITDAARLRTKCYVIDQLVTRRHTVDNFRIKEAKQKRVR